MSFTSKFRDWTASIRDVIIIVAVIVAIGFAVLTVTADFLEDTASANGLPGFPDKAVWMFTIEHTGNAILAREYSQPSDTEYTLHGYWEIRDGKYKFKDLDLTLNEKYFGPIRVERIDG